MLVLSASLMVNAQDAEQPIDTLTRHVAGIRSELDVLKRIKVSGYMQAQFQIADSAGQSSFGGGSFGAGVDKRFMLRRARVKIQYDSPFNDKGISTSQFVFQIDATEKGLTIKDMYVKFTDPWCGWFSLTTGMQNRPFGHEIGYSSSMRESPERARLSQIVFPNERDLGAMVTLQGPKASNWNWIKLEAGMFNGLGGPSALAAANDFDKYKDFIASLSISRASKSERLKWGLGASMYNGGYRVDTVNTYIFANDSAGTGGFMIDTKKSDVSANVNNRDQIKRSYMGFNGQISIDWAIGITSLRAEYVMGEQPGTSSSTASQSAASTSDFYKRNFTGMYLYFIQNLGRSPFQLVVKYDNYDPNTDVSGDEIGKSVETAFKKTGSADIAYSTLGLGLAYRWDANLKLVAYYDMVTNETSEKLGGFTNDLLDNLFTLRAQIKF